MQLRPDHSIIMAHRKRYRYLKIFLRSVELAIDAYGKNNFEIVLTDLDSDTRVPKLIKEYKNKFAIQYFQIPYKGIFWKTKALNHSARHMKGQYVTMLDIDSIIPPKFFVNLNDYFIDQKNQCRLSHRVRFLNEDTSVYFRKNSGNFTIEDIQKKCINMHEKHTLAKERYGTKNQLLSEMTKEQRKNPKLKIQALGNSHFTMPSRYYYELGGFAENFIGYSCEDLDFNRRSMVYIGKAEMIKKPDLTIYHVSHAYEPDWKSKKTKDQNKRFYELHKKMNVVCIKRKRSWGVFE